MATLGADITMPGLFEDTEASAVHGARPGEFKIKFNRVEKIEKPEPNATQECSEQSITFTFNGILLRQDIVVQMTVGETDSASSPIDQQDIRVAEFLGAVYALDSHGLERQAMRRVIDYLDDLQTAGLFNECDAVFRQADPAKLSPEVITCFLGITLAARNKLRFRKTFYDNSLAVVEKSLASKEAAVELLRRFI